MCGFIFLKNIDNSAIGKDLNNKFNDALNLMRFRGPDELNLLNNRVAMLGHVRLAIIDPHEKNTQPMQTEDSRYWFSFNGEIYNHKELRVELERDGVCFLTNSDTEVLFKLIINNGVEAALKKVRGMFSFIIYDVVHETTTIVRDHFGQKPLYYTNSEQQLIISSTIESILHITSKRELDLNTSNIYLSSNGVFPEDATFIKSIKALPAGHIAKFKSNGKIYLEKYFNVATLFSYESYQKYSLESESATIKRLDSLMKTSIERHLVSDVPVGVLLSGGLDSSLVFHYAKDINPHIKAFTKLSPGIEGIPSAIVPRLESEYNFSSNYLAIEKSDYLIDLKNFIKCSGFPSRWGGGPPMYRLCRLARTKGVRVLLGGDGVDEYCGGYDSQMHLLEAYAGEPNLLHSIIGIDDKSPFYDKIIADEYLSKRFKDQQYIYDQLWQLDDRERFLQAALLNDLGFFLQVCNLPHSDAYSMQASVELRNPMLDIDLVGYLVNQPMQRKMYPHLSGHSNKYIFRALAENKIGNWMNVKKEGTRNYSKYISDRLFWNFSNFKIGNFLDLEKEFQWGVIFRLINLEIFYRSVVLNQVDFLEKILSEIGRDQLLAMKIN